MPVQASIKARNISEPEPGYAGIHMGLPNAVAIGGCDMTSEQFSKGCFGESLKERNELASLLPERSSTFFSNSSITVLRSSLNCSDMCSYLSDLIVVNFYFISKVYKYLTGLLLDAASITDAQGPLASASG